MPGPRQSILAPYVKNNYPAPVLIEYLVVLFLIFVFVKKRLTLPVGFITPCFIPIVTIKNQKVTLE